MSLGPERLVQEIRRLALAPGGDADSDAALLGRFVGQRDESAFAALVARHGSLVFGVCRRVLRDAATAEDAFQATFLVLARKASTVRPPEQLAAWLYGTARRVALQAQRAAQRRQQHERQVAPAPAPADPLDQLTARELLLALDEEVQRLPPRYRLPILVCCLEGKSLEEAGRQLGWSAGSVKGRLERGRRRLQERLVRRGLTLSAALGAAEVARGTALAGLGVSLSMRTLRGALACAGAEVAPAGVSAEAIRLASAARAGGSGKLLPTLLLVVAAVALGAGLLTSPPPQEKPAVADEVEAPGPQTVPCCRLALRHAWGRCAGAREARSFSLRSRPIARHWPPPSAMAQCPCGT
jgi:RNA polymerase sigma factor (sigma-70 family)